MKYLSLFSGIGGFELGIKQAYERILDSTTSGRQGENEREGLECNQDSSDPSGNAREQIPTCIGFSEIDKYAVQIYQKHFNHTNYGDITKIITSELPDFDLLVGGFPCQSFSIAGKRGGFEDTRGTLFFEVARIAKDKRPRLIVLENVKGLLSHDSGKTFYIIISTLDELGYDLQWQVLNSKNFGVPQNRERVFIVGHLRGTSRPQVFPIIGGNSKNLEQIIGGGQGNRVYDTSGVSTTIASLAGGQGAKTGLYATERRTRYVKSDIAGTLTSHFRGSPDGDGRTGVIEDMVIRRLTPTECERLQGFPDGWTEGISDTQRYKTLGNAVTVNVIKAIMEKIYA